MNRKIIKLEPINVGYRPKILLMGNGINLLNKDSSQWKQMIESMLDKYDSPYVYSEIEDIPAPMQVVVATKDHVDEELKSIAADLKKTTVNEQQKKCCGDIFSLDLDAILTTNYSFELEQTLIPRSNGNYGTYKYHTRELTDKERKFSLYSFYKIHDKKIWHIHGNADYSNSMIMGTYYYGKLSGEIQRYVPEMIRRYKGCVSRNKAYTPVSWVDYFLLSDIYIMGLGLYLCEEDLWWLICCKKRNFPDTKIYYYSPHISGDVKKKLRAYDCEMINIKLNNNDYYQYYQSVIDSIRIP